MQIAASASRNESIRADSSIAVLGVRAVEVCAAPVALRGRHRGALVRALVAVEIGHALQAVLIAVGAAGGPRFAGLGVATRPTEVRSSADLGSIFAGATGSLGGGHSGAHIIGGMAVA